MVLSVPQCWWPEYKGYKKWKCTITNIDVDAPDGKYFTISCEAGYPYPARYDTIFQYADKKHPQFSTYFLPKNIPRSGEYQEWLSTKV
jgi:hypothetical protein